MKIISAQLGSFGANCGDNLPVEADSMLLTISLDEWMQRIRAVRKEIDFLFGEASALSEGSQLQPPAAEKRNRHKMRRRPFTAS